MLVMMEGHDEELAGDLAAQGVLSVDDLGDQSVDDLMVIEGMDEEVAGALIMKARERWIAEAEAAEAAAAAEAAGEGAAPVGAAAGTA